jgi:hypothetical protein
MRLKLQYQKDTSTFSYLARLMLTLFILLTRALFYHRRYKHRQSDTSVVSARVSGYCIKTRL